MQRAIFQRVIFAIDQIFQKTNEILIRFVDTGRQVFIVRPHERVPKIPGMQFKGLILHFLKA